MTKSFIPLSVPNLKGNELSYVSHAIETEWVSTAGPYVEKFEKAIAEYVGVPNAVACQSGSAGIHVGLQLLGVKAGDLVIAPNLTFIATVNPIKYLQADPVLVDCDDSLCIDPEKVRQFCQEECSFADGILIHKTTGKPVKAIVVVHVFGNMADMSQLLKIAQDYNLKVLEDATEALGTRYTNGDFAGKYAGTMGDIGVYSFNGNKIITTGGGGMMVSNNQDLLSHAKHLTTQAKSDPLYFEHDEIGYNYRLTNIQAALGLAQLEQLESFIETKKRNYGTYKQLFQDIEGLKLLPVREDIRSNYWFYALACDQKKFKRDNLIQNLSEQGIQTRPIWGLVSDQVPYKKAIAFQLEKSREYREKVINIPCSTNLTEDEVRYVVETIIKEAC